MQFFKLLSLSALFFILGLMPNFHFPWIALAGWIPFFVYIFKDIKIGKRIAFSLTLNLIVAVYAVYWLDEYGGIKMLIGISLLAWILPGLVIFCYILEKLLNRLDLAFWRPAIWAFSWALIMLISEHLPSASMPLRCFFVFPAASLQIVHWIGYLPLTALWILFAASLAALARPNPQSKLWFWLATLGLATSTAFGAAILSKPVNPKNFSKKIKITVIQHNLSFRHRIENPLPLFREQALKAAAQKHDLIVFPLYTLFKKSQAELFPNRFFSKLAIETKTSILIASEVDHSLLKKKFPEKFTVFAFLYSPDGKIEGFTRAVDISPMHDQNQYLAPKFEILNSRIGKLGILLCYEAEKAKYARLAKKLGAEMLIGLSNPGDYPHSNLPYYSWDQDRLRAIESGLFFVRASVNGFSGLIDPRGRTLKRSHLRQEEIINLEAPFK